MTDAEVVIIGSGLAGLTAARELCAQGVAAVVLEQHDLAGGRCASVRMGDGTADTGAQFFTARSDRFGDLMTQWQQEGCRIRVWCDGFGQADRVTDGPTRVRRSGDGHSRFSVTGGMAGLALHLAQGLDVQLSVRCAAVRPAADNWVLALDGGGQVTARAVVLTPPLPQSLALLEAGEGMLDDGLVQRLDAAYHPCLTTVIGLDRAPAVPTPGAVQFASGPVGWLADNAAKGASVGHVLTVNPSGAWSRAHEEADDTTIIDLILDLVADWLGDARPTGTAVVRWRYSGARRPSQDGALLALDQPGPLVIAGDALAGAKVEGAVTSGLSAADLLVGLVRSDRP